MIMTVPRIGGLMTQDKVVISIGGSILIPDDHDDAYIAALAALLKEMSAKVQFTVVCGGGKVARYYTDTGRALGGTEDRLDLLGIGATRLNAGLLALALGDLSSSDIPTTAEEAAARNAPGRIVVMGGTAPGHTTDAVAVMVARALHGARVINATSVDAVYSADPRTHLDAVKYDRLTIKQLGDLVYKDHGAGKSSVFDPLGVKIAAEEKIDIAMVAGRDLADLKKAILGEPFKGTYVSSQ